MPCKEDVKTAILNKTFEELTDGRNTFSRLSDDTIQINGKVDNSKTKAQHKAQAIQIAKNLIARARESFQDHVRGTIEQKSEYDPITVTFRVNPAYVEYEFSKLGNNIRDYSASPITIEQSKNIDDLKSIAPIYNKFSNEDIQYAIEQLIPNSKVKQVVFHGTDELFDNFDKSLLGINSINTKDIGIFATASKEVITQAFQSKFTVPLLVNIKTPNKLNWEDYMTNILDSPEKIEKNGFDGIIGEKTEEPLFNKRDMSSEFSAESYIVFEPSQIIILNSPKTISKITDIINNRNISQGTQLISEQERTNVLNNTGANNNSMLSFSIMHDPVSGVFEKFVAFKRNQLVASENRLGTIRNEKESKSITKEKLDRLNKEERELKLLINGNREIGLKGLKNDIEDLAKESNVKAISYYVEKDLKRLDTLSKSNNAEDLSEAEKMIKFYLDAGTFELDKNNPFFEQDEIFLKDQNGKITGTYKISKEDREQFEDWARKAVGYQNILNQKSIEILEDTVNNNALVKNTYGDKQFTKPEITSEESGLKDTDWFSMWTMDITHGLMSNNGLIPQVMFSTLVNSIEGKEAWSRGIGKYVEENNSEIQKELIRLGHGFDKIGILGVKGASFNLFKQISKEGNETNNLVQRHTREFSNEKSKKLYNFNGQFKKALAYIDYEQRNKAVNSAFENLKQWRLANQIIIDPNRLEDAEYKKSLISLLGEDGFNEEKAEQERLGRQYESDKQSNIEYLLVQEGKDTYNDLSDKAKNSVKLWENNHDPKRGYDSYHSVGGLFYGDRKSNSYMDYNNFVPRKYKAEIKANIDTDRYEINDTNVETGHYDKSYETIQSSPILKDFYNKLKEFCQVMYETMDYDLQEKTAMYTLPGLMKTSAEIINDKNLGILSSISLAFRNLMDRFRTSFGVVKQGTISYAANDPTTGKPNYKVNDNFLRANTTSISNREMIEQTKFLQAYNSTRDKGKLVGLKKSSVLRLSDFNESSLIQLAQYLHSNITLDQIRNKDLSAITSKLNTLKDSKGNSVYTVDIGRLISDFSLHSVVQSQSFDLPKLMTYFSEMTMAYAARKEALPLLNILRKHYDKINAPKTNNVGETIFNRITGNKGNEVAKIGIRTGATRQMDNYFERVILNNYGNKHIGVFGFGNKDGKVPLLGKNIYSTEERKEYDELTGLINNETDEKKKNKLIATRDGLGKTRTLTAAVDNMLNWIRTLRLGYNLSSMTTNFLEGVTSNMILSASDEYFNAKEMFYGYRVIKHSFIKNATFGYLEHPLAKKNRSLVNKFNVIIDSRNELQKSYTSKVLDAVNPYAGNQKVEYINQSPIMIAILRTMQINDKDGTSSSIWDAYNNDGNLKDEFKTPENIENWEALEGDQYQIFKQKLEDVITLGHGNYHDLRGMMIKSNSLGKAGMMFKTWLPEAIYWRFGSEQDNIRLGKQGVKGRYWSYGAGTGAVHGAALGTALFGPLGAIIGGVAGAVGGGAFGTNSGVKGETGNRIADSGIGILKESIEATRLLFKKCLGMPINLIAGKQVIDINNKQFLGKGKYFDYSGNSTKFTQQDSNNLNANMADISIQLAWLGLILMVKHLFWDDDDKPDDAERIAHNILVNKLMNLSSQAAMYTNPISLTKSTVTSIAVEQYFEEMSKEVVRAQKYFNGQDIIQTGTNAGQSGLAVQTKKMLLPGLFKDSKLGFEGQAQRIYPEDSPFQKYFHSQEYQDKDENKRQRASRRDDLKDDPAFQGLDFDAKRKAINKAVDAEIPSYGKTHPKEKK